MKKGIILATLALSATMMASVAAAAMVRTSLRHELPYMIGICVFARPKVTTRSAI